MSTARQNSSWRHDRFLAVGYHAMSLWLPLSYYLSQKMPASNPVTTEDVLAVTGASVLSFAIGSYQRWKSRGGELYEQTHSQRLASDDVSTPSSSRFKDNQPGFLHDLQQALGDFD